MKCPTCDVDNRNGMRFCENCGVELSLPVEKVETVQVRICKACGAHNRPGIRFCENCGDTLPAPISQPQQASETPCPSCGRMIPSNAKSCDQCGNSLLPQTQPAGVVCHTCGTANRAGVRFCEHCGTDFYQTVAPTVSKQAVVYEGSHANPRRRPSNFGRWAVAGLGVVVLAGIAIGIWKWPLPASPEQSYYGEVITEGELPPESVPSSSDEASATEAPQGQAEGNSPDQTEQPQINTDENPASQPEQPQTNTEENPASQPDLPQPNTNENSTDVENKRPIESPPEKPSGPPKDTAESNLPTVSTSDQSGFSFFGFTGNSGNSSSSSTPRQCITFDSPEPIKCISSIIIFVHGASAAPETHFNSSTGFEEYDVYQEWIDYFFASGEFPELANVLFVPFRWGNPGMLMDSSSEWLFADSSVLLAPDSLGHRSYQVYGLMDMGWFGVWKLQQTVARIQAQYPGVPITIISHSMGTEITLAALQEGMKADYWVLMGSPLDQEYVSGCFDVGMDFADPNVHFSAAARNVSGFVWNLFSRPDLTNWAGDWATLPVGGIGAWGLEANCRSWEGGDLGYGSNVYNSEIPNIYHSTILFGDSWWSAGKLFSEMDQDQQASLIYALAGGDQPMMAFQQSYVDNTFLFLPNGLVPWAVAKPSYLQIEFEPFYDAFVNPHLETWEEPDKNHNTFYAHLYLPEGMESGWYADDKDFVAYRVTCFKGSAIVKLSQAIWSDFKTVQDWDWVPEGASKIYGWNVDSDIYDATLWVQISNQNPGVSECDLSFYSEDY